MNDKIKKLKEKHQKELDNYMIQISEHIKDYGYKDCDYLRYRQHRVIQSFASIKAIEEVEKILNE